MSEQQGRKRGSAPADSELTNSGKKPREPPQATAPCAVVKQEREEEGDAGQGSSSSSNDARRAVVAALEPQAMEQPQLKLVIGMSVFHCQACFLPLKPPAFMCESGHIVCCTCRGKHGEACDPRRPAAATFAVCPGRDVVLGDAKMPCQNEEFGCKSLVVYYQAGDHHGECQWAPCFCPEPGCELFSSPAWLADHLNTHHRWPLTNVRYGEPCKLPVPSPEQGCHVLVGEGDRSPRVFLVSPSALGAATAVSLVCVSANAGGGGGQFMSTLRLEVPGNKEKLVLILPVVRSGDLSCGLPTADTDVFLAVPPVLQPEAPNLFVCIDKADAAAANSTPPKVE
nr:unnamed protein product [Digitaria exilis]